MEMGVIIAIIVGVLLIFIGINARRSSMKNASGGNTNETWVDVDVSVLSASRFREAVAQGNKIEAIKIYHNLTGIGLKDAKTIVDTIMEDPSILDELPVADVATGTLQPALTRADIMKNAEFRQALSRKNKIEAIKIYRNLAGVGLKEAKDAVDGIAQIPAMYTDYLNNIASPEEALSHKDIIQNIEFRQALSRGNKIEAIKIYRELSGLGLKEAKDAVEAIVANPAYSFTQPEVDANSSAKIIPQETDATIRELILKGKKIEAIKVYRDFTGADLKSAKDAVEQIEREIKTQ